MEESAVDPAVGLQASRCSAKSFGAGPERMVRGISDSFSPSSIYDKIGRSCKSTLKKQRKPNYSTSCRSFDLYANGGLIAIPLHEGQCGLCTHFGETHIPMDKKLIEIHSRNALLKIFWMIAAIRNMPRCT